MFDDTVTIFHLYGETWYPYVLSGVEVQEVVGRTESKDGSTPNNSCSLYIPKTGLDDYHKPKEFTGAGYSLVEGDFFAVGDFGGETIDEADYVSGYQTYMKDTYDGVYNINSVAYYDTIPHIEVSAS